MKLSVALCTFNGEKHISEQLESVLCQQMPIDEIIICDDGSSDKTLEIIADFQKSNPSIKLFENPENLGVIKNFEKAINLCSNGIVFLCDQDDIWFPDKTIKIVEYFNCHPQNKAVFHNLQLYNDKVNTSLTMWQYLSFDHNVIHSNKNLLLYTAVFDNVLTGAAFAFKKDHQISFTDVCPIILHDYQLLIKFALSNELGYINANLGFYRLHEGQQVGAGNKRNWHIYNLQQEYNSGNLIGKLNILMRSIKKYVKYADLYPSLRSVIDLLEQEVRKTKKDFLRNYSYLYQRRVLINWYRKNLYQTNFCNIFYE